MIAVLALVVSILAVFFGPLVAWTVARQQSIVAVRETWLREFRERVAALLSAYEAFLIHIQTHTTGDPEKENQLADINDAQRLPYFSIRLLIAERGHEYTEFISSIDRLRAATSDQVASRREELFRAAEDTLQRERAAIAADPGV
jgi:hypothetical protein